MNAQSFTHSMKAKKRVSHLLIYLILILFAIIAIFPFAWMISSSLKFNTQVFIYPIDWIPDNPQWGNYADVFQEFDFLGYFGNTAFVSIVITAGTLLTSVLASYAFAKLNFRGRDKIFLLYIETLMIPWQVIMIPQFLIVNGFHLTNTHWGLILTQIFSPFGVFLLKQFFMGIPSEYTEAAKIDGCSHPRICFQIIVPMAKPALTTLILLTFMGAWNDYLAPLIYLRDEDLRTLQIGLHYFQGENETQWALLMAGAFLSMIPVLILYIFAQKQLIAGMASAGGLKG